MSIYTAVLLCTHTHSDSGITHTFPQIIDSYTNKQESKPASHQSETGVTYQFYASLGAATSISQIKWNWIWPILNFKKRGERESVTMLTNHFFISVSEKSSSFLKSPQTSRPADHRRLVMVNGVGGSITSDCTDCAEQTTNIKSSEPSLKTLLQNRLHRNWYMS